jgi:mRNA (guanine-N7-)-methyltransferase
MDKEFPNGVAASNQSWEAIRKPLTIEDITRGPRFMRDFHSEIKSKLIMKYAPGKVVLDIGSGKGEDIGKYVKAGAKQVVGIDIVEEEYPHPDNFQYYKVSSPVYDVRSIVKNTVGQFDMININFAIHYFFENKTADLIYSSHLFEYFDREEGKKLLTQWFSKLKSGGIIRIAVPDFQGD